MSEGPIYPLVGKIDRIKYLREAAAVRRCHTIPILNQYEVGGHSFNMLTLLRILWPEAPIALLWAIVEHDMPERLTGDIPAPTKWFGIINKDHLTIAEMDINTELFGEDIVQRLTFKELSWLKGLDIMELYMFCLDQQQLGNSNLFVMGERIERFIKREAAMFPREIIDCFYDVKSADWRMMPDLGDI